MMATTHTTPEMIEIYENYPRKVAKPEAFRAIAKAISRHGAKVVKDGTIAYAQRAREVGRETSFIPYPASYFNAEMYNDDLDALLPRKKNSQHKRSVHELRIILKAKEDKRAALRFKHRIEGPTGNSWDNESKRQEAILLTKEINAINEELSNCL